MTEKIKILIVEDNQTDAELLQRQLNKSELNFISETVQTREAYEEALNKFVPDIILSDFALPSFDGLTAFLIKQEKCPYTPFIIVSGTIGEEKAVEIIKIGITDYVLKDKIFSIESKIIRALKEAADEIKKRVSFEQMRLQNEKLFEIAALQSHQVRAPIANILGLINLFNFEKPNDPTNVELIKRLQNVTEGFDAIIHQIMQKTQEIKNISI